MLIVCILNEGHNSLLGDDTIPGQLIQLINWMIKNSLLLTSIISDTGIGRKYLDNQRAPSSLKYDYSSVLV